MVCKMVKVSVLIPVYNAAAFLEDSIDSILNQTFKDFDLLLLYDCSTDNSEEIIKKFNDNRIKYYKNEQNLGISGSRNKLMDLAQGEYFAIMDNDDLSLPERFAKQVSFLDEHKDVTIVGTWGELFNNVPAKGIYTKIKKIITNMGWVWRQPANVTIKETLRGCTSMHSSMMVRRDDFIKYNIRYNPEYTPAEDYDMIRQVLTNGLKICNIQEVLFKYHLYGGNFSVKKKQLMKISDAKVKNDIKKFLQIENYKKYPYWLIILRKLRLKWMLRFI